MSGVVHYPSMDTPDHRGQGDATFGYRSLGNGRNGNGRMSPNSPLKLFGQAKKCINDIFKDIGDYICEADAFIEDILTAGYLSDIDCSKKVRDHREKVMGITEVLTRDHMKVVFFGRTSNGKSTTINAMLRDKILPTGIGHTTNCFIQVEGSESSDGYVLTEDQPDQPKSVQTIKQLAHALSTVKLKENSLIRILWPKEKCRLLREDVVLVDSPGIDVTPNLDLWIDKFCLDADVFVLVSNAESTLMQTEKNFFHKVSARLSKPNIFILQNRWDISVFEEDVEEVRKQHLDRNLEFLCNELNVVDKKEGNEHVFFVSAREALASRLNQDKGTPTPTGMLQEGFQTRLFDFANFERRFEECISKSAVKTKFEQHTHRGQTITSDLRTIMDETYSRSLLQNEETLKLRREKAEELGYLEQQLLQLTNDIKDKIKAMTEDVERKVSSALNDEIRRLAIVVDEFDRPFHPDSVLLNNYKKDLHEFVEEGLGRNIQARCTATLLKALDSTQTEMTERVTELLPEGAEQQIQSVLPKRDFEMVYRLDCRNLCADFQEDISFRFSLGITNLMRKVFGHRGPGLFGRGYQNLQSPMTPQIPSNEFPPPQDNEMMMTMLTTFATLTSRSTVGVLIISGLVARLAGWKVIVIGGGMYGFLYLYERLTWTTKAKERAFKQQYVDYAGSKLRLIVDLTSSNCSHQVQQELSSTFARLCNQADISKSQLEEEVKHLDKAISQLTVVSSKAKTFRNKADWLHKALNTFSEQYLKPVIF